MEFSIALTALRLPLKADDQDDPWTLAWVFGGAFAWSQHQKSEVEVAWNGTRTNVYETDPPGGRSGCPVVDGVVRCDLVPKNYALLTHSYQLRRVSLAHRYEFRPDGKFRPLFGAGVGLHVDREQDGRCEQNEGCKVYEVPLHTTGPQVVTKHVRAFGIVGFRFYASTRGFLVGEMRVGPPESRTAKLGFGFAF